MMTTGERPEQIEGDAIVAATDTVDMVPAEVKGPNPPPGLTGAEQEELKSRALDLVNQLGEASGGQALELADSITSLGVQTQRRAGTELELLRNRVGQMITEDGASDEISKDLVELRATLSQINPHEIGDAGLIRRVVGKVPFVGNSTLKILEKIAVRYEPASKHVALIETKLREGRTMLVRDNVELRKLYEQVEEQQQPIQKNAYLGELVMQNLGELLESIDDTSRVERIRSLLHDVSIRVQDLRTMESVYVTFFVSIDMTRQNNTRLGQSVERTLALGANVVIIGLALQSALMRQKSVFEATQRTRDFLGNLIAANASAVLQHTEEIGDVYNNPVIATDKIVQAHDDLMEAMDVADRLKIEGIQKAKENIAILSEKTREMAERTQGLREQQETVYLEA